MRDITDIDLGALTYDERCDIMNQVILPRPIAWVVTDYGPEFEATGRWNLAPYSYFNAVSSDPPTVVLGINNRDSAAGRKDTVRNLRRRPHFTISVPSAGLVAEVDATSRDYEWGVSEAVQARVPLVPWAGWPAPRVSPSKIALACALRQEVQLGPGQSLLIAQVERVFVDPSLVDQNSSRFHIDLRRLRPVARAGHGQFLEMTPTGRMTPTD